MKNDYTFMDKDTGTCDVTGLDGTHCDGDCHACPHYMEYLATPVEGEDFELDWAKIRGLPSTRARIKEMKRQEEEYVLKNLLKTGICPGCLKPIGSALTATEAATGQKWHLTCALKLHLEKEGKP